MFTLASVIMPLGECGKSASGAVQAGFWFDEENGLLVLFYYVSVKICLM